MSGKERRALMRNLADSRAEGFRVNKDEKLLPDIGVTVAKGLGNVDEKTKLKNANTDYGVGVVYLKTKQYGKARERLLDCIKIRQEFPLMPMDLALAYEALGQVELESSNRKEAVEMFKLALELVCNIDASNAQLNKSENSVDTGKDLSKLGIDGLRREAQKKNQTNSANPVEMRRRLEKSLRVLNPDLSKKPGQSTFPEKAKSRANAAHKPSAAKKSDKKKPEKLNRPTVRFAVDDECDEDSISKSGNEKIEKDQVKHKEAPMSAEDVEEAALAKLENIALNFTTALQPKLRTYAVKLVIYKEAFLGSDAVDVMVVTPHAKSRAHAVDLLNAMNSKLGLFRHVSKDKSYPLFDRSDRHYKLVKDKHRTVREGKTFIGKLTDNQESSDEEGDGDEEDLEELREIAKDFERGMQVKDHRRKINVYKDTFNGNDAVTFLVNYSYAESRPNAVVLGNKLMVLFNLFAHVSGEQEFKDAAILYRFTTRDRRSLFDVNDRDPTNAASRTKLVLTKQGRKEIILALEAGTPLIAKGALSFSLSKKRHFLAADAVSFLVDNEYAVTRPDALEICRLLMDETGCFAHATNDNIEFCDSSEEVFYFVPSMKRHEKKVQVQSTQGDAKIQRKTLRTQLQFGTDVDDPESLRLLAQTEKDLEEGLALSKHPWKSQSYEDSFTGKEAVDFLLKNGYSLSRPDAVHLCKYFKRKVLFKNVSGFSPFMDDDQVYRWTPKHLRPETTVQELPPTEKETGGALTKKNVKKPLPRIACDFENDFAGKLDGHFFYGKEAVSWFLQQGYALSRKEATNRILSLAIKHNIIKESENNDELDEFTDDDMVYRIVPESERGIRESLLEIDDFKYGELLDRNGELAKAQSVFEVALERAIESFGDDHECTGLAYEALANVCRKLWKNEQAQNYLELALGLYEDRYCNESLHVARVHECQGDVYKQMGSIELAEECYESAVYIRENVLKSHKANGYFSRDEIYEEMRFLGEAKIKLAHFDKDHFESAKILFQSIVDESNVQESIPVSESILPSLLSIGNIELMQKNTAAAVSTYSIVLKSQIGNKDRIKIAGTLSNLGSAYVQVGDFGIALECFERAIKFLANSPSDPPLLLVASIQRKLGSALAEKGDFAKAKRQFIKALSIKKTILDDDNHPEVLYIDHELALLNYKQGNYSDALKSLDRLVREQRKNRSNPAWLAKLLLDICSVYAAKVAMKGEKQKAKEYLTECWKTLEMANLDHDHQYHRQYEKLKVFFFHEVINKLKNNRELFRVHE